MCILCVIQKWSRRVATMLPWLVIPLIGLWALSQLLPPPFRFEITSPRLACVFVLLITLFWYEILMPQLSAWRVRRSAKLREIKRFEAIEMQKLRKTATRRCRNCLTAYRDQNPGGGKFMCSCCGHISKRPVLDLPLPPGMGNSGILNDLVGKGGKILNGKAWSGNGWMCGRDWLENGSWIGGSFSGKSSYSKKHGYGFFCGDNHCLADKSYSRLFIFVYYVFTSFFWTILWLWRKIFRGSSSVDDASTDSRSRGMLDKRGENGGNGQESRGEKARRKAEERKLAKLEKEMLEEEERKQREEVSRLVEEQRRLRDDRTEAGKDCVKGSPHSKERGAKKEAGRRRQEKKKERDRGSSKSNCDAEELEKKTGKENERNKGSDRKERYRSSPESMKSSGPEIGPGFKVATASSQYRVNSGTRYLDRMSNNFLSSSRAFTGGGLFRKASFTSSVSREQKSNVLADHPHTTMSKKDAALGNSAFGRSNVNEDDKTVSHPILIEPRACTSPKKTWQQLFASSGVSSTSSSNVISKPDGKCLPEVLNPPFSGQLTTTQSFDNPINLGLPSPFASALFPFGSKLSSTGPASSSQAMFFKIGDTPDQFLSEDAEIFEDPCYVPDPISLLGPVSESLDNFQLDLDSVKDLGLDKLCTVKTVNAASEISKPSPIESPLSRSRFSEERNTSSFPFPSVPKTQDSSEYVNSSGTWQMWNSSPLGQDTLALIGGPANWAVPPEMNDPIKEGGIQSVPHKTMASLFKSDEQVNSGPRFSQDVSFGNCQNGGKFVESLPGRVDDPWLPKALFGPPSNENQILLKSKEKCQNGLMDENCNGSAANLKYELPTSNSWAVKDRSSQGSRDGAGNSLVNNRPHAAGFYSNPDVQSLWSYDLN